MKKHIIPVLTLALLASVGVSAAMLEQPEAASEQGFGSAATLSGAEAYQNSPYGELIYFNDFENSEYYDDTQIASGVIDGLHGGVGAWAGYTKSPFPTSDVAIYATNGSYYIDGESNHYLHFASENGPYLRFSHTGNSWFRMAAGTYIVVADVAGEGQCTLTLENKNGSAQTDYTYKWYQGGADFIGTPVFEETVGVYTIPDSNWRFNILGTSGVDFDIDNLRIYKAADKTVTYHNPDGSVITQTAQILSTIHPSAASYNYQLVDNKMNRVTGWSLTEGGEIAEEVVVNDNIDLYAVMSETVDADKYGTIVFFNDFETNEINDTTVYGGWYNGILRGAVLRYTANSGDNMHIAYENGADGNKVMHLTRSSGGYAGPMMLSMASVGGTQAPFPNGKGIYTYMVRFSSPGSGAFAPSSVGGSWNIGFSDNKSGKLRGSYTPTSADLAAGWKDVVFSDNGTGASFDRINFFHNYMYGGNTMMFDDVRIFYRPAVTFHNADGTTSVVVTDKGRYEVPAMPAAPIIKNEGGKLYRQIGWSMTEGGEIATVVDNLGKDFDLYAVFEDAGSNFLNVNVMSAKVDKTLTATSSVPFTAAVVKDYGYTDATVTFDKASSAINVKAAGYAGNITVTLTTEYGNFDQVISLIGGEKWRPGLNVFTGTPDPLDFENLVDLDLGNWTHDTDPLDSGRGANIRARQAWNGANTRVLSTPIEKERPMKLHVERLSDIYTSIFINVQASENQFRQLGIGGSGEWEVYDFTLDFTTGKCGDMRTTIDSFSILRFSPFNGTFTTMADDTADTVYTYLDNVALIPAYKITYVDNSDESVLKTVYALYDDDGNVITEYVPYLDDIDGAVSCSLEKDGVNAASVALAHEDITLYVKIDRDAPVVFKECQIRASKSNSGLRFGAFIDTVQRETADEYGFIVARADAFSGDYSSLVFPNGFVSATGEGETKSGTTPDGVKFVCGANYVKGTDVDYYTVDERNGRDGFRFNTVLVGMTEKAHFMTAFVARPYIVVDGTTYYGVAHVQDIYSVAKLLYDAGDVSDYVKSIVEACEN